MSNTTEEFDPTSENNKPPTSTASSPFDSDPGADIVLLSSDGFEFRARTAILSFASPVFSDMFSFPQPVSDIQQQISSSSPCVQLSETKIVIDILLRYCYPVPPSRGVEDFDAAIAARSAAEKYNMDYIKERIEDYIEEHFGSDPRYMLLLYREAYERREGMQARFQALYCLRFPLTTLVRLWKTTSSNSSLQKLIEYHLAVSAQVANHVSQYDLISHIVKPCCPSCNVPGTNEPKWWCKNIACIVNNLYTEGPTSRRILIREQRYYRPCVKCHLRLTTNWNAMEKKFHENIEKEAERVRFSVISSGLN